MSKNLKTKIIPKIIREKDWKWSRDRLKDNWKKRQRVKGKNLIKSERQKNN